jgi:hypothetical protein
MEQDPIQVLAGCGNHLEPGVPKQEIVDVVGNYKFLDPHSSFDQALFQIDSLMEVDIAIVVGMDEKYRRLPGRHP